VKELLPLPMGGQCWGGENVLGVIIPWLKNKRTRKYLKHPENETLKENVIYICPVISRSTWKMRHYWSEQFFASNMIKN